MYKCRFLSEIENVTTVFARRNNGFLYEIGNNFIRK